MVAIGEEEGRLSVDQTFQYVTTVLNRNRCGYPLAVVKCLQRRLGRQSTPRR